MTNINPKLELMQAVKRTLESLKYKENAINFFCGSVKAAKYPMIHIYTTAFDYQNRAQHQWRDIQATVVAEFTYAADISETELWDFGRLMEDKLTMGLDYERRGEKQKITTTEFSSDIVEGFYQVVFNVNYSIDTEEKIYQDSIDLMQDLDLTFNGE